MSKLNLGIIGAGPITKFHLDVIINIKPFRIFGITSRTNKNCIKYKEKYNIFKIYNNYKEMILDKNIDAIIILVSPSSMTKVIRDVIIAKKPFFAEKPIGLNFKDVKLLNKIATKNKSINMIGFNRRFYHIFHKGLEIIKKKGKLLSISIEGHERFWKVKKIRSLKMQKNWLYANSSHTIDLIRFFGNEVKNIKVFSNHYKNSKSNFSASILFKDGKIGTYQSNWYSPGGWSVKLYGEGVTVIFDPLESGYYKNTNNKLYKIESNRYDRKYKPGFYKQMEAFKKLLLTRKKIWPTQDITDIKKTFEIVEKFKLS